VTGRVRKATEHVDHMVMASLPVLPRFALPTGLPRAAQDQPPIVAPVSLVVDDQALRNARRLQAQDHARRATSVPPPARRAR
jgi:hypothetical protein